MIGFYLCGATGEGVVMQPEERMRLAETARDAAGGRAKLIAHVGAIDLTTSLALARHAGEIGLDAVSSVPPFFYGYSEEEILYYYEALAEAAGIPVLIYASPLAGAAFTCERVERLMSIPLVIGLKWTSYDYFTMRRIKELRRGDINVLNGPDECLLCGLAMGADGGIGACYNVMPGVFQTLYSAFRQGDIRAAQDAQFKANKLIDVLIRFGVIPGVKALLAHIGYDCGYCTRPMKRFDEAENALFLKEIEALDYQKAYLTTSMTRGFKLPDHNGV
jgi:N-acetylneuraminate lyase